MHRLQLFLSLWVLQVHSIALKGPVLPYYEIVPCELGVIHFDKITDLLWRGELNLEIDSEFYSKLGDVEFEIEFKKEIDRFLGISQNSNVIIKNKSHNTIFKVKGEFPKSFHVFVPIHGNTIPEMPVVTNFRLNDMTICSANAVDSSYITERNNNDNLQNCGSRPMKQGKVTFIRTESKAGDWPWHAAILLRNPNTFVPYFRCGGSVISRTAILTAGHCMFNEYNLQIEKKRCLVIAGANDLRYTHQTGTQTRNVERIITHPNYSSLSISANLAIVLVNELHYTPYVQPICIEGVGIDKTTIFGKWAMFAGFGKTEQRVFSDTLRSTDMIIQDDITCTVDAPKPFLAFLNQNTFCAGFGPNIGDAGGGLAIPRFHGDKVSWFLRGVFSRCRNPNDNTATCKTDFYAVFTDVTPHYSWIYHHAGLENAANVF